MDGGGAGEGVGARVGGHERAQEHAVIHLDEKARGLFDMYGPRVKPMAPQG